MSLKQLKQFIHDDFNNSRYSFEVRVYDSRYNLTSHFIDGTWETSEISSGIKYGLKKFFKEVDGREEEWWKKVPGSVIQKLSEREMECIDCKIKGNKMIYNGCKRDLDGYEVFYKCVKCSKQVWDYINLNHDYSFIPRD